MSLNILAMTLITLWTPQTPALKSFEWRNRVLLIFAQAKDGLVEGQRKLIESNAAECRDRDLLVFVINESPLRARFKIAPNSFTVVLIGKDGSEKLRQHSILQPEKLFALIDSMPMRRAGQR